MVIEKPSCAPGRVVAFAGGGTGGHLYPALAVADALRRRVPEARFVFFGTQRTIDQRIVNRKDYELIRQTLPPLSRVPWRWPGIVAGFHRSSLLCRSRFENDQPAVVIGTGGLSSVPAVRQARRAGIPTAILNPDAVPGRANRHLAGMVDVMFVQWEETLEHLPRGATVRVYGCAIRPEFRNATRSAGLERFNLDPQRKTLLVTGASQGARTINQAVVWNLGFLRSLDGWQILHLTGDADHGRVVEAYRSQSVSGTVLPYTDCMAEALAVADLIVSRAGASTLAEITASGKASILMPYPFHRDMHQLANARCLVRAGAARIVPDKVDEALNGPALRGALERLLLDGMQRAAMADAAKKMGHANAASDIADRILELIARRQVPSGAESLER